MSSTRTHSGWEGGREAAQRCRHGGKVSEAANEANRAAGWAERGRCARVLPVSACVPAVGAQHLHERDDEEWIEDPERVVHC